MPPLTAPSVLGATPCVRPHAADRGAAGPRPRRRLGLLPRRSLRPLVWRPGPRRGRDPGDHAARVSAVTTASDAKPETLLLVLAGTLAMLPPQLAQLPPEIRERVGGPDLVSLTLWREAALLLRAELQAASAAVTPEIQHGPV